MMKFSFELLLLLATYGCKHPPETQLSEPPAVCLELAHEDSCQEFHVIPGPIGIEEFRNSLPQFLNPSVNPNNPDEFVYLYAPSDGGVPQWTIRKHNSVTHEDVFLINSPFPAYIALNWSKAGWISITAASGKIYLIKEDGSMFHFLINSGSVSDSPMDWLNDGKRFLYYRIGSGMESQFYRIANLAGESLDSIETILSDFKINEINQIVGSHTVLENLAYRTKVKIYDLNSKTEREIWQYAPSHFDDKIIAFAWLPDNQYCLFLKDEGLFKLSVSSGIVTQVKQSCDNKHIVSMDVSNNGKFILYTKRIRRVVSNTEIGWMDEIWKMDINGCNEERILPTP